MSTTTTTGRVTVTSMAPARETGGWFRRIALAVVMAALLMTSACNPVAGSDKREITAYFADSAGLFVGNDVGILGVPVGTITAIEPAGDKVKVTLELDGDHKIPAKVGAVVVARSVATDRYVELTPVYTKGAELKAGDDIPISRTRTPVDFDQVLESLNGFATGIAGNKETTDAVKRFIDAGTRALQGRGPLLNQTIHSLAEGVNGLSSQREDVAATLRSLDVLLGAVAENEGTARTFIQQVARAADLLAAERGNFRTAMRELDTAVTLVAEFAVDNKAEIVEALGGSTKLMRTLLTKQDKLSEILRVMPLALENIQLATNNGNRLPVVLDPTALDPLGGVLHDLCESNELTDAVCDLIDLELLGRAGGAQ